MRKMGKVEQALFALAHGGIRPAREYSDFQVICRLCYKIDRTVIFSGIGDDPLRVVGIGVWRALYKRQGKFMRNSRVSKLIEMMDQFDAEDTAQAALDAVEQMLASVKTNGAEVNHG